METTAFNTTSRIGSWSSAISRPLQTCGSFKCQLPTRRGVIVAHLRNSNFRWRKAATTTSRGNVSTEAVKIPTSVPVRVARELAQAGYRYLDVRTPDEFSIGHPTRAINVPYMYRVGSGMVKNPSFLRQVSSHFRKHDEIIIGCESGQMSFMASTDLLTAVRLHSDHRHCWRIRRLDRE
ncbi:rhodanese-like domain-containing protein 15, chloroplastic isoform X2 [Arabidopsis lyrata subsp. lyrata]|uniref:rhodanese-like domain-containing protein 15, chloroplastic isoform X2 n=1 Tax=Arabidopsis lyrata subsp. lyrata TaxID=81972 RepID=UPI000A29C307|nr:rhodanese-like domain-containing protein 15, chloroplastic isoform X2 [Arabidopsis lyrata subsp. lyrata]|eukprot:XP_020874958.1 rhodanese-like domain-containing protein 15, chloroplastic isoform X2 [Arabidopsis lyrata subsp. lyrata]